MENDMSMDQNVVHRKVLTPWYDTDAMCCLTIFFALAVFLFSMAGMAVCGEVSLYQGFVWVPVMLMLMSSGLILSIAIRIVSRYIMRYQNRYLMDFSG